MTVPIEPTDEEVQALFDQVLAVIDNKPGNLQWHVVANMIAALSLASMDNQGLEPFSIARGIYKSAKLNIKNHLDSRAILTRLPKGAKRH